MESYGDVFIKLENKSKIFDALNSIKNESEEIKKIFQIYEELILNEKKILDSWKKTIGDFQKKIGEIEI